MNLWYLVILVKIVSNFDGFRSGEYILFSIYCLKDTVPVSDIECLRKFVLICQYLSLHDCCR